jgi:hypothetical protein
MRCAFELYSNDLVYEGRMYVQGNDWYHTFTIEQCC